MAAEGTGIKLQEALLSLLDSGPAAAIQCDIKRASPVIGEYESGERLSSFMARCSRWLGA